MLTAGLIRQMHILSFFFYSLQPFFVIFLRVGRFEGEGVGTAFVCFESFNVCHLTVSFPIVFEKMLPWEPNSAFKKNLRV